MIRIDAEEVLQALRSFGIDRLYHITDRENWPSIKKNGILSLDFLNAKGINPGKSCSNKIRRIQLCKKGLGDQVHLSFSASPPCLDQALQAERLQHPVIVEVSLDVFKQDDTYISPCDALEAKNKDIPFITEPSSIAQFGNDIGDSHSSSEILVKGFVPPSYILNASEIDRGETTVTNKKQAIVFIIDHTSSMSGGLTAQGRLFASASMAAQTAVNETISSLLESCITPSDVSDKYEFALLGFGTESLPGWNKKWGSSFVDCKALYREMIRRLTKDGSKTEWAPESAAVGTCSPAASIKDASSLVQDWLFHNKECPPPIVVLVTNGKSIHNDLQHTQKEAGLLKSITSLYGNAVLACYMLSEDNSAFCEFPTSEDRGKLSSISSEAATLFDMVSIIDDRKVESVREKTGRLSSDFRAIGINGSLKEFLRPLLDA